MNMVGYLLERALDYRKAGLHGLSEAYFCQAEHHLRSLEEIELLNRGGGVL